MTISWPSNTVQKIDAIRDAIGRDIVAYVPISGVPCTEVGCELDPMTNLSTNQFCPICGGNYWLATVSGYVMNAHVRHKIDDLPYRTAGGIVFDGDAIIQVKYTTENMLAVDTADYFEVDGKEFIKEKYSLRGVPEVNRIVVTLKEREGYDG